jgi:hypothetical protein
MNDDSKDWCVLSLQRFPKELKKKLKMRALEKDIELQTLCAKYLEAGLAKDDSKPSTASAKR